MSASEPVVLYVDPDASTRSRAVRHLEAETDLDVVAGETVADAVAVLEEHRVECVVTEYDLADGGGFEVVDHVRERSPDAGCFLYTETGIDELASDGAPRVVEVLFKETTEPAVLSTLVATTIERRTQTAYPLPDNENDRLDALATYDFDDPALNEALSRVVDLAAAHFEVETATVNVLDRDTQQFVACHGSQWPPTNREASVCTYAIVEESPVTVVGDTRADPRFRDNQVLEDLGIRFYAGGRVTNGGDLTLGTLCIYADRPRSFGDDDRTYLSLLADEVAHLLSVHRELAAARGDGLRDGSFGGRR